MTTADRPAAPDVRREPAEDTARHRAAACRVAPAEESICPACGATMRLWANYHRCRTCGYKESCCF